MKCIRIFPEIWAKDTMPIFEFDPEHRVRQGLHDGPLNRNAFLFGHSAPPSSKLPEKGSSGHLVFPSPFFMNPS